MKTPLLPNVEELTWASARPHVKGCPKELLNIFDEIDPPSNYTFIRMRYPFGAMIMHNDSIYVPCDDKEHLSVPLLASRIPQAIKKNLGYRSIPFGMVTGKSVEVYREAEDRAFSIELSGPNKGIEIGIFEYFGLTPCYSVSSGARSLFMVPKISETRLHNKLMRHYYTNSVPPKDIFKHWYIFKNLYNSGKLKKKWESEILYLTKPWNDGLEKHKDSIAWSKLKSYLYEKGFEHSALGRKKLVLDLLWQKLMAVLQREGFKPDVYTSDTLKHIIYIFLGGVSGSRPQTNDFAGPITDLQKAYIEDYGLKQIPTIMGPVRFSPKAKLPVYYSMQYPTIISSNPNARKSQTIIEEMRELIMLKSKLADIKSNIKLNDRKLHEIVQSMKLEIFHRDLYSLGKQIRPTNEIPKSDPDFLYSPIKKPHLKFADNGDFIRGCVKISTYDEK